MNKRGISPLIATVLIVGFTIILAVIVINFVMDTTQTTSSQQACRSETEKACIAFSGSNKIGFSSVTGGGGPAATVTISNLASQDAMFVVTLLDSSGVMRGEPHTTSVVSTGGTEDVAAIELTLVVTESFNTGDEIMVVPAIQKIVEGVNCTATCTSAAEKTTVL